MKKIIVTFLIMFMISFMYADKQYELFTCWFINGQEKGTIITNIIIKNYTEKQITFTLQKEMQPFSQILFFETVATLKDNKYYYSTIDNFGNKTVGFIILENSQLVLFLDCENFSKEGKNFARFYGNIETLKVKIEN